MLDGGGNGGEVFGHVAPVHAGSVLTGPFGGIAGLQLCSDHGFAFIEPSGQLRHLGELLHGEGEPGFYLRVERVLLREIDRNVEQAAGRGDHEMARTAHSSDVLKTSEGRAEVGAPDVASVHQAEREPAVHGDRIQRALEIGGPAHEVEMQPRDRERSRGRQVIAQRTEVVRQQNPRRQTTCKRVIGGCEARFGLLRQVERQDGFIDLRPRDTRLGKLAQDLPIDRQHGREQVKRVRGVGGFGEGEEADRAKQHRARADGQ